MRILSWQRGGNGCAGQFLWVKPTLGVDLGDVAAGTTHANVPLRHHHQSWERATWMLRNIDLGVNFRLMRWDRKSAIWGGGRESGSFVLSAFFIVVYFYDFFWFCGGKFLSAAPIAAPVLVPFSSLSMSEEGEGVGWEQHPSLRLSWSLWVVTIKTKIRLPIWFQLKR